MSMKRRKLHELTDRELMFKLADVVRFYADPETYFAIGFLPDRPTGPFMEDFSKTYLGVKPGRFARRNFGRTMVRELNRRWPIPAKPKPAQSRGSSSKSPAGRRARTGA